MQKQSDKDHRLQISKQQVGEAVSNVRDCLFERLREKGYGALVSRHEIQGVLTEEYHEAIGAVHEGSLGDVRQELIDLADGCIFGVACIDAGGLDW